MSLSNNPKFKDALEQFCEAWEIDHALLLLPTVQGDVSLLGINLNREQIIRLIKIINDRSTDLPKKRLDS